MRLIIVVVLGYLMSNAALAQSASYTGQQARDIKALSSREQADLLAGRGMGLARAGELNHYPGPAHALELQSQLGLSPAQVATLRSSFERMATPARPLGAELVYRERVRWPWDFGQGDKLFPLE